MYQINIWDSINTLESVFGFFPSQYPPEKISIVILTFITFCLYLFFMHFKLYWGLN